MKNLRTNKMESVHIKKLLLTISLPIMFSMVIQALYNIVDSIFIAKFGEKALSAISITFPMQTFMIAVSTGTYTGLNSLLARTIGQRNLKKARIIVQHGVFLSLLSYLIFLFLGIFFTKTYFTIQTTDIEIIKYGIDYMSICLIFSISMFGQQLFEKILQANGHSVLSMISQLIGAVTNIILDPIFIFGLLKFPALGAKGAAIATIIGQFVAVFVGFMLNQIFNKELKVTLKYFCFDITIIKEIYIVGLPSIVMQAIGSITNFLFNAILLRFSTTATAFWGIYYKLQNFIFMPIYGLTSAMLPIMSYNLGAKRKKRVINTLHYGLFYMVIIMLLGTAIFEIAPIQLLRLFNASDDMLLIGKSAIRIISTYFIFEGFCLISQTAFQALNANGSSLMCCLIRQILILLPVAYILSLSNNINYIWFAYPITGFISMIACLLLWKNVYRKKIDYLRDIFYKKI